MKVYTGLVAFAPDNHNACILTDSANGIPIILLNNKSGETLDIIRDTLYNISGVSSNFYGHFDQAGFFESTIDQEKFIFLLYKIYFPAIFDLSNQSYKWTKLVDLDNNSQLYNIIRYLYGSRQ